MSDRLQMQIEKSMSHMALHRPLHTTRVAVENTLLYTNTFNRPAPGEVEKWARN